MPVLTKINTNVIADNAVTSAKIPADAVLASEIAAGAVSFSELDTATGIESTHHKVPVYANDAARLSAIGSPVNGMIIYNTASGALQQYNGVWSTIAPAPNIASISGFLNDDTDSTLTIFGTNFTAASSVKMYDASAGGNQIGSNATTTFVSNANLKAVFGAGSIGASGSTAYIEVDNAGAVNRFATAITVNADPTVTHAGATGTSANTTTHLGTYGGATTGGGSDENTKLLLNFDRGGGVDIEDSSNKEGNGHNVVTYYDVKIKASPFGDGKTAMQFNGTASNLAIPTSSDFDFLATSNSNSDFTMEGWCLPTSISGDRNIISRKNGANNANSWYLRNDGTGSLTWYISGSEQVVATATWKLNAWHHWAVVREGDIVTIYVDGMSKGNYTSSNALQDSSTSYSVVTVGARLASQFWSGYMDEIRIVNGVAVYTGNFTPPTARFSGSGQSAGATGSNISAVSAAQTKYLLQSNRTTDATSNTVNFPDSATTGTTHVTSPTQTIHTTLYNHAVSTVVAPALTYPASGKAFGSTGAYFDGAGDFLTVSDSNDWNFADATPWTIDFWIRPQRLTNYDGIISFDGSAALDLTIGFHESGKIHMSVPASSGAGASIVDSDVVLSVDTWYHVAITRDGTTTRFYLNGVHKTSNTATFNHTTLSGIVIGRYYFADAEKYFQGYLDLIRISKGIAHWTGTDTFTPPTKLYGSIATQVLPTITLTGTTTPALAADEDIEFTDVINTTKAANNQKLTDSGIGIVLTNVADSNTATLTGTIASDAGTTHSNMAVKAQVRKSLGDAAYNNSTLVTFSGSTTTAGLAPGMPLTGTGISVAGPLTCGLTNTSTTVTAASTTGLVVGMQVNAFTGVPAGATIASIITDTSFVISSAATATDADAKLTFNTIISAVASSTTLTLSNTTTNGAQTGNTLIFEDLTRVTHVNGTDTLDNAQAMYTIATGTGGDPVLFNARRYQGNGTARAITGFGIQPDLVWIKRRDSAVSHQLFDIVRGATNRLYPDTTGAETVGSSSTLSSFNSDGFSTGTGSDVNAEHASIIGWGWKAGGAPSGTLGTINAGTPTGAGTISNTGNATNITQTVSQTSGLSITEFNGHSSGVSLPHNLGATPAFIIIKNTSATGSWMVWHQNLSEVFGEALKLDVNDAEESGSNLFSTAPSSTIITTGTSSRIGGSTAQYIMYAFKDITDVSKFGTYTGSPGAKTVTGVGFSPSFIITKNRDAAGLWMMYDVFRGMGSSGNADAKVIHADGTSAEDSSSPGLTVNSDGWAMNTSDGGINAASTYIYAAFA